MRVDIKTKNSIDKVAITNLDKELLPKFGTIFMNYFLECILKDKMPLISGESALDTLKVIECIRQSSSEEKRFQVNYEEN